jgi:hypothetical protein
VSEAPVTLKLAARCVDKPDDVAESRCDSNATERNGETLERDE